jgi:hypothetical protein
MDNAILAGMGGLKHHLAMKHRPVVPVGTSETAMQLLANVTLATIDDNYQHY